MAKVKILSDSTCDLPAEIIEKYDIGIIPLYINLGGKVYKDNKIDVTPSIIYDFVEKTGELPGTIGATVEDFKIEFEKWHNEGYEIVCHTISSDMSCTYQNAVIASEGIDGVYVVDSRNLCTGVWLCVMNSAELAMQGKSAAEIAESTAEFTKKVNTSFVINTLDYLKKGGRCSSVAALGANLLKIKPQIVVDGGTMRVGKKFRGPLSKVRMEYVDTLFKDKDDIDTRRVVLAHTYGVSREQLDALRDRINQYISFDEIIETEAGATITSHSGPETIGIMFIQK